MQHIPHQACAAGLVSLDPDAQEGETNKKNCGQLAGRRMATSCTSMNLRWFIEILRIFSLHTREWSHHSALSVRGRRKVVDSNGPPAIQGYLGNVLLLLLTTTFQFGLCLTSRLRSVAVRACSALSNSSSHLPNKSST